MKSANPKAKKAKSKNAAPIGKQSIKNPKVLSMVQPVNLGPRPENRKQPEDHSSAYGGKPLKPDGKAAAGGSGGKQAARMADRKKRNKGRS